MTQLPQYIQDQIQLIEAKQEELRKEKLKRAKIEFSDEYIELNRKIDDLQLQKAIMVEGLQDERMEKELAGLKTALFAVMEREGREVVGNWKGKYREEKGVNTRRLLEMLHGDIDRFFQLSTVTQVSLKAFAKAEGGDREEMLLDCIEVVGRKLIDIEPIEAQR
jgi:hypothetical protein